MMWMRGLSEVRQTVPIASHRSYKSNKLLPRLLAYLKRSGPMHFVNFVALKEFVDPGLIGKNQNCHYDGGHGDRPHQQRLPVQLFRMLRGAGRAKAQVQ